MIRAYVVRHGVTDISPAPEGWLPIGLNRLGWSQAMEAAHFLFEYVRKGHPKPTYGVASDLLRAEETLAIIAKQLKLPKHPPMKSLRAFECKKETPLEYEIRNHEAFNEIFSLPGIPVIAAHRSSTGFLGKHHKSLLQNPDYRFDSLLLEGGILGITDSGIIPIFRAIEKNWPKQNG